MISKEHILNEIKRLAEANNGQPPGMQMFATETNIRPHEWRGRYWVNWGSVLKEAGFEPNKWNMRLDSEEILRVVATVTLRIGHVPSEPELMMQRASGENLPSRQTISLHFKRDELLRSLRMLGQTDAKFARLLTIVPELKPKTFTNANTETKNEGWVYLLKSGDSYKIGRSEQLEKRVKQINVALPEAAELFHAIQTDDPSGIEAYWHNRFADRRLNGEWFKLSKQDVAAFKRRKFQ